MLDRFESPAEGIADEGDARMWYAVEDYRAAGPTDNDDPEDEILDDEDLDGWLGLHAERRSAEREQSDQGTNGFLHGWW